MSNNCQIKKDSTKDIKKVVEGTGTKLAGSVVGKVLSLLKQVIIARFFGVEGFGLYILGLSVLKISELLAICGLNSGAMKFVSIYKGTNPSRVKGTLFSTTTISFINGIIIGLVLYLSAGTISSSIFHKPELKAIIQTFAFGVPFVALTMVAICATQGFHTTKYFVYIKELLQPIFNVVLILFFIYLGLGIIGVIYAFIISYIITSFWSIYFIKTLFPDLKDRTIKPSYETKELLFFSIPLVFMGVLHLLLSWTDILMLGYFGTSAGVGIYRAASQIPIFLVMVLSASNSIYAPVIAELFHQGEMVRLEKIFKSTTRWVFYLTLPASIILFFSAKEVMSVYGVSFIEKGVPVLIILAIAQFINCVSGGVAFTLIMTGKQNVELLNSLGMVIFNIILNYILIPKYGIIGAAIATAVSIGGINLIRLLEVYLLHKIQPYDLGYVGGISGGIVTTIILFLFNMSIPHLSNIATLLLNSLVAIGVFFGFMFLIGIPHEDRYILDLIKTKFNATVFGKVVSIGLK